MIKLISYTSDTHTYEVSDTVSNNFENPIFAVIDSIAGGRTIRKLALANLSEANKLVDIEIVVTTDLEQLTLPDDLEVKLIASESEPTLEDFDNINSFNTLAIIGELQPTSSLTLWLYAYYPGTLALNSIEKVDATFSGLTVQVSYTEEVA